MRTHAIFCRRRREAIEQHPSRRASNSELLGLIADAGVMLYFGWGLIGALIAGSLFSYIAVTGLAGLTITTLVALIPSAVVQSLHDDGLPARDDVLPAVAEMIQSMWSGGELVRV